MLIDFAFIHSFSEFLLSVQNKCEVNEKKMAETKMYEDKKHAEEIAYFSRSNKQLKAQLEAFLAPSKK